LTTGLFVTGVWITLCIALLVNRKPFPIVENIFNAPYIDSTGWNAKAMVYLIGIGLTAIPSGQDACAQ
jgi:hypothetical protein